VALNKNKKSYIKQKENKRCGSCDQVQAYQKGKHEPKERLNVNINKNILLNFCSGYI